MGGGGWGDNRNGQLGQSGSFLVSFSGRTEEDTYANPCDRLGREQLDSAMAGIVTKANPHPLRGSSSLHQQGSILPHPAPKCGLKGAHPRRPNFEFGREDQNDKSFQNADIRKVNIWLHNWG